MYNTPVAARFDLLCDFGFAHPCCMRIVPLLLLLATLSWAEGAFGTWKMNPSRSTFSGDPHPKAMTLRLERHAKGEAFALDRIRADGHAVTVSMILYLDGTEREFQGDACFGAQSSRSLDARTIEVIFKCRGWWALILRRQTSSPNELILDITKQQADGQRFEEHLILEKQ